MWDVPATLTPFYMDIVIADWWLSVLVKSWNPHLLGCFKFEPRTKQLSSRIGLCDVKRDSSASESLRFFFSTRQHHDATIFWKKKKNFESSAVDSWNKLGWNNVWPSSIFNWNSAIIKWSVPVLPTMVAKQCTFSTLRDKYRAWILEGAVYKLYCCYSYKRTFYEEAWLPDQGWSFDRALEVTPVTLNGVNSCTTTWVYFASSPKL